MLTKKSEKNLQKVKEHYKNNEEIQSKVQALQELNNIYKNISNGNFSSFLATIKKEEK